MTLSGEFGIASPSHLHIRRVSTREWGGGIADDNTCDVFGDAQTNICRAKNRQQIQQTKMNGECIRTQFNVDVRTDLNVINICAKKFLCSLLNLAGGLGVAVFLCEFMIVTKMERRRLPLAFSSVISSLSLLKL